MIYIDFYRTSEDYVERVKAKAKRDGYTGDLDDMDVFSEQKDEYQEMMYRAHYIGSMDEETPEDAEKWWKDYMPDLDAFLSEEHCPI